MGCGGLEDLNPFHGDREEKWLGTDLSTGGINRLTKNVENIGRGLEATVKAALDGDPMAIAMIAITVYTGYVGYETLIAGGAAFGGTLVNTAIGLGVEATAANAALLMGIQTVGAYISIAISVSSVYGLAVSYESIGEMIRNGQSLGDLYKNMSKIKDTANLAMANMWINGNINLWRAGGVLYDAPKAGDLQFNVTGNLNTVRFLGMEDKNTNDWYSWTNDRYHDFSSKTFGNMAGDMFFSVKQIV